MRFENTLLRRIAARFVVASISSFVLFAARFLRTVLISRFLSPADYGVVVALTTIFTIFEMAVDVGLDRFVTIKVGADRAQAVAAAQQIAIARGALVAIVIAVLAPALADLFGIGSRSESVRWLALLPMLRAFGNLRVRQVQQEHRNGPTVWATCVSQLGALLVVIPALQFFRDERALLVSLYVDSILYTAATWIVIGRERVDRVDPEMRRAAIRYGLPLVLNGMGLVVLSQMDRLIVSNLFALQTLALYALVMNLALVPLSPLGSAVGNLAMGYLVPRQKSATAFKNGAMNANWSILIIAAAYSIGVAVLLDFAVPAIYGANYRVTPGMHCLVSVLAFLRFANQGPTLALLILGRTKYVAASNAAAGVGLLLSFVLGYVFRELEAILVGLLIGDIASLIVLFWSARESILPSQVVRQAVIPLLVVVGAALVVMIVDPGETFLVRIVTGLVAAVALAFEFTKVYRSVRDHS